jgi:hypothetical protein
MPVGGKDDASPPRFSVDANWPKPLPNGWSLGQVSGVATDADDHVWVLQRPRSLTEDERGATLNPPQSICCAPAPPVLEFDAAGTLLRSWGGPSVGYDWPQNEHGIHVDAKGFVWITGNGENDGQVLKFTRDGKFVMQIGKVGPQTGNADLTRLGQAAGVEVDTGANEVYVADGYYNRRVIVFDSETGAYKRHWGAYGKPPSDAEKPNVRRAAPPTASQLTQFGNPVHCARIARDGLCLCLRPIEQPGTGVPKGSSPSSTIKNRVGTLRGNVANCQAAGGSPSAADEKGVIAASDATAAGRPRLMPRSMAIGAVRIMNRQRRTRFIAGGVRRESVPI